MCIYYVDLYDGVVPPFLGDSELSDSCCQNLIFKYSYLGDIS